MSRDLYVQDTAEVFFTSLVTGNVVGVGYATIVGLEQTTEETDIRGGIGNKLAYTIRGSKDLTLNITSATFKPEFLALTQGTEYIEDVTGEVTKNLFLKVKQEVDKLVLELPTDLIALTTVRVEDTDGSQQDVAVTTGKVELPIGFAAKEGDELEVFYLKTITGRAFDFDAKKHGAKVKVEYNTLCYDKETATPYSNLYFVFPECIPSSSMSLTLTNGEAWTPEMNFKVTAPKGSDVLGTKYEELIK